MGRNDHQIKKQQEEILQAELTPCLSSSENVRAPHGQERVCASSLLGRGGGALCEVLSPVCPGLLGPRSKPVLRCSLYLS